ncbi:MAG TPA: alpha/beta hydrolase, partial [Pyrinomonadaceae bacterium]|nr:alpha/beta hydrolase [Pyrinomonadaceae bacterium]
MRFLRLAISICVIAVASVAAQAPLVGHWTGVIEREGKTWRVEIDTTKDLKTLVTFSDLDVPDIPFTVKQTDRGYRLERPQPNGSTIVFDGGVDGDSFSGKWSGLGGDGTFSMKRSVKPEPAYREEEVLFENGVVKLAGTLLLPLRGDKHPAVVITHGSSPNERTTYRSWGRRFAEAGIAALIYDKRGAGKSTGDTRSASMENLADDAVAGVQLLSRRADIDASKIGVMGHSQGGWIAP